MTDRKRRPRKAAQAVPRDEDPFEIEDGPDDFVEQLSRGIEGDDDPPDVDGWVGECEEL